MDEARHEGAKVLPFELKALEVCLESVCKFLEAEVMFYFMLKFISSF